ncbi:MAG: aspartyl protease family protein [Steroidobacteraceae bacterium]
MKICSRIASMAFIAMLSTQAIADCKLQSMAELPVTLIGLHPLIMVQVDGTDVPVVLDSGATFNLLSYDAATKLNLRLHSLRGRVTVSGVGGAGHTLAALAVADVRLGAVRVADTKFIIAGAQIGSASGFIGNVILRNFDIDYDLAGGVVKLARASDCDGVALADWAKSQPYSVSDMDRGGGSPTITGYINGVESRIEFDTGASVSILDIRAAARAGITPKSAGAAAGGDVYGVGRSYMKTWVVPVASVKIGEEETRNTRLLIGDISNSGADMLLGTDFFLSHHVYLSNSQHKVYFTYNGGSVFNLNPLQRDAH